MFMRKKRIASYWSVTVLAILLEGINSLGFCLSWDAGKSSSRKKHKF